MKYSPHGRIALYGKPTVLDPIHSHALVSLHEGPYSDSLTSTKFL